MKYNRLLCSIAIFVLLSILIACCGRPDTPEGSASTGMEGEPVQREPLSELVEIHDGDTVTVLWQGKKRRTRLIGIDTPEFGQDGWGRRARNHLLEIVRGHQGVFVEVDVQLEDKYGRLLAYLWLPDGRMINEMMVRDGYAFLLTIPPDVTYVDRFKQAQKEARSQKKGIWSDRGLKESPSDYRKKHPRN